MNSHVLVFLMLLLFYPAYCNRNENSEEEGQELNNAVHSISFRIVFTLFLGTVFILSLLVLIFVNTFLCDLCKSVGCFKHDSICLYMNHKLSDAEDDEDKQILPPSSIVREKIEHDQSRDSSEFLIYPSAKNQELSKVELNLYQN